MDIVLLMQIILVVTMASLLYMVVGIIPGTDETSVLVPATIFLFAINAHPYVILAFFIASITSLNLTDSIPTALTSIPGGVMSTPLVEHSKYLKENGLVTKSIRKMTTGSFYGTIFGFLVAMLVILVAMLFQELTKVDLKSFVASYGHFVYFGGAILLSVLSKKKIVSLLAIIPFGIAIVFIVLVYPHVSFDTSKSTISYTPFFLSITLGPLLLQTVKFFFPQYRKKNEVYGNKDIMLEKDEKLTRKDIKEVFIGPETKPTIFASIVSSFLFFLSPVGVTMLVGQSATAKIEDKNQRALTSVSVMNGISNATYLSGVMISLFAFLAPISPAASGPGASLFAVFPDYAPEGVPPLFTNFLDFVNNNFWLSILVIFIAFSIALVVTMYLTLRFARKMTSLVFKYIPQEAVIALLIGLVVLIVYLDSGIAGLGLILILSLFSGFLNSKGVSYGVLFMSLYTFMSLYSNTGLFDFAKGWFGA